MKEKPKPCPVCGEKPIIERNMVYDGDAGLFCAGWDCNLRGPLRRGPTAAIRVWNGLSWKAQKK